MYMAQEGRLERKLAQKSLSNKVEKLANLLAIVLSYFLRVIVLNKRADCDCTVTLFHGDISLHS